MSHRAPRLVAALAAALVLASAVVGGVHPLDPAPASAAGPTVNGGGSSFAKLEIDQWRAEIKRQPYGITINYSSQGSSYGRQQYRDGNLDFGASDIPFLANELTSWPAGQVARKNFVYVPVSAGGLGFMFNVKDTSGNRITDLKLSRRAVCRIFTEPNMVWNDPDIAAANPGVSLPANNIRPIVRADGSGTSYVLSEFCSTVQPDVWRAFVALKSSDPSVSQEFKNGEPTSNWPVDWGKVGSALAADGVAAAVADESSGQDAITYNEAGFAKLRGFPNASVENAAGQYTQPTEEAVSTALAYAQATTDAEGRAGTFKLNYTAPDPAAYFPSTYSYIISQTTGFDPAKGEVLARFLCYAVTKGQRVDLTKQLGYARLSQPLVDIARNSIAQIPGAPAWDQCAVADNSAAPAPPTTVVTPAATTAAPAPEATAASGTNTAVTAPPTTLAATPGATVAATPVDAAAPPSSVIAEGAPAVGGAPTDVSVVRIPATTTIGPPVVPPTLADARNPPAGEVAWVLLQGAAVCGLGALAVSGRRRQAAS